MFFSACAAGTFLKVQKVLDSYLGLELLQKYYCQPILYNDQFYLYLEQVHLKSTKTSVYVGYL